MSFQQMFLQIKKFIFLLQTAVVVLTVKFILRSSFQGPSQKDNMDKTEHSNEQLKKTTILRATTYGDD